MRDHPSQATLKGLTCRDVAERATVYLEDESPFFMKIRIGLHLVSCMDCRVYVKQLALVSEAMNSLPKHYPSPIHRLRLRQQFTGHHSV